MKIDLIVPTYKPDENLICLLDVMSKQTVAVNKVIIMNTEQKFYDRLMFQNGKLKTYPNLEVRHLSKKEFDHGRTRNQGVKRSDADYFIMMTQDAKPFGEDLVEKLLNMITAKDDVAACFARQIAREDARETEKFTRTFNYPEESSYRSLANVDKMGIKAYYLSNVCAIYRRDVFDKLGGFINHAIFNEDMIYAAEAIKAGYEIGYCADAMVYHSHNYTDRQQFSRNFDIGVSHAMHPEIFANLNTDSEGMKLVRKTADYLSKSGHKSEIFALLTASAAKYLGYKKGLKYKKLSRKKVLKYTMNSEFWAADDLLRDRSLINARLGYGRSDEELAMLNRTINSEQKRG